MRLIRLNARYGVLILALMWLLPDLSTAAQWWQATGVSGPVTDLVVQTSTGRVVAAVQGANPGIYRSNNHGQTFTKVATFTRPFRLTEVGGLVFAATSQGLYKSSTLTTWTAVTSGLPAGKSVSFVGRSDPWGVQMYATVAAGTERGLYRSLDTGLTWARVLPNAGTQAVAQGHQCGTTENAKVFAGGMLSPGGPPCTMSISTDNGSTWSCSSFPYIVKDLQVNCYAGPSFKDVYLTSGEANVFYRGADLGASFVVDSTGISDCCGSNTSMTGTEVGALNNGIYTRNYGPTGTPWTQFDTNGLTDLRITRWLRFEGTVTDYVVATPTGVFYYNEDGPPCQYPCP